MVQWLLYSLAVAVAAVLMPLVVGLLMLVTGRFRKDDDDVRRNKDAQKLLVAEDRAAKDEAFEIPSPEPGL